ncbi:MAG: phage baseplate assembly protein V [Caulobacter sp.]|nr:phage baseplate assembly protein V [Caulobacter sp.]
MAPRKASIDAARMMVGRAGVALVDDSGDEQLLQLELLADEVLDDVVRHQDYGFNSAPLPGATAVTLAVSGQRGQSIAVAVGDRRYRLKGLQGGEVALADDLGQKVHLTRDGIVIVTSLDLSFQVGGAVAINATGDVAVTTQGSASVSADGDATIAAEGNVQVTATGNATVTAAKASLDAPEVHLGGSAGGGRVARVGDTVAGGLITGGSTKVFAS